MTFAKKPEPEQKLHVFAACREVATLLGMARRVMGQASINGDDQFVLTLWAQLHSAQALADRIGYGEAPRA